MIVGIFRGAIILGFLNGGAKWMVGNDFPRPGVGNEPVSCGFADKGDLL